MNRANRLLGRWLLATALCIAAPGPRSDAAESDAALIQAAQAVAAGQASPLQKTLVLKNQARIQSLAYNGKLGGTPQANNAVYQASQKTIDAGVRDALGRTAKETGLEIELPERGKDAAPGTDNDPQIRTKDGKPLTYEQWKAANEAYQRNVRQVIREGGGSPEGPVDSGADLLPDPDNTSPENFKRITSDINSQGGTAYDTPEAARAQAALNSNGKQPMTLEQGKAFVDNMQKLANDKFTTADLLDAHARQIKGANPEGAANLEAQANICRSQGAKYIQRIDKAANVLAKQNGIPVPEGGKEGPFKEITDAAGSHRGQGTSTEAGQVGAMGEHLVSKSTMSYIETMAKIAKADPSKAAACEAGIAQAMQKLPPAQQGQAIELVKTTTGSAEAAGRVAQQAQTIRGNTVIGEGGLTRAGQARLTKFNEVAKKVGPWMLIYDAAGRLKRVYKADDPSYQAGKELAGFSGGVAGGAVGGYGGYLIGAGLGALYGAKYGAIAGIPGAVIGGIAGGLIGGIGGYMAGDHLATPLGDTNSSWWEKNNPDTYFDAQARKKYLDPNKDIFGQLLEAGFSPEEAAKAAVAYAHGSLAEFNSILKGARDKLLKEWKDRPVRRFNDLATNEVQDLLNCLCSASLGANPWVAQGYNPKVPAGVGPEYSCGNLANGPCMASGFGCWRSFIRWSNPGISDCLAAFNLPTNSGFVRGQIDNAYQSPYEKPFKAVMKVEPTEVCPGDQVTVTWEVEGGRGDYQFGYEIGWPLQKPEGMKTRSTWGGSWCSEMSSTRSVTFTVDPTLKRGFFDGQWVYTRPAEAYPTYVHGWARSVSCWNGQEYPVEVNQNAGVRLRSHAECEKLHPPPPPETTKPPPKKPPVKTGKGGGGGGGGGGDDDQINAPEGVGATPPEETGEGESGTGAGGGKTTKGGKHGKGKGGGTEGPEGEEPEGAHGPKGSHGPKGPGEETGPTPSGHGGGVSEGGEEPAPEDCYFGGGGTAIDNGPMNIFVEVPPGQRLRVTIKGSDGFSQTIEGVGKVEIARPRNPNGTDTIVMENLDRPECRQEQVSQYDTNGIPIQAMPPSATPTGTLQGAEAPIQELPPGADAVGSGGQLAGFVEGTSGRVSADTDTEFGNNQIFSDSQIGETKSQADVKEADGVRDQAGWAAQGTKKASAAATAAEDAKSSWGNVISDAIFGGVREGAEAGAKAFGGKAADHVTSEIFDDDKEDEGEAADGKGGGAEVAGGSSDSGSSGGGGGSQGSSKGSGKGSSKGSSKGGATKSGHVATESVNCPSCGKLVTYPMGQPPKWCPYCCAGPGSVECAHCGYRWCGKKGPSPDKCPNCGWGKGADEPPDGIPAGAPADVPAPEPLPTPASAMPSGGEAL